MPLKRGKGKATFKRNVRTELQAGKPPRQALAIAYAVQRKARGKRGGRR
jgi:hypothetical protein